MVEVELAKVDQCSGTLIIIEGCNAFHVVLTGNSLGFYNIYTYAAFVDVIKGHDAFNLVLSI